MLRLAGILGVIAVLAWAVGTGAQLSSTDLIQKVPTGPLEPYVIPEVLQRTAIEARVPSNFRAAKYIAAFKNDFIGDQLFYTDLLVGADVLAQAWAKRKRTTPSEAAYRSLVCFLSVPLPGCRPKSKSNQEKVRRVREPLLVGMYGSERKRRELADRLTPRFFALETIDAINLETVDIEEYIKISDLLR